MITDSSEHKDMTCTMKEEEVVDQENQVERLFLFAVQIIVNVYTYNIDWVWMCIDRWIM